MSKTQTQKITLTQIRKALKAEPKEEMCRQLGAVKECIDTRWVPLWEKEVVISSLPRCQLCVMDADRRYEARKEPVQPSVCTTCVIYKVTGRQNCNGTPFADWQEARRQGEETKTAAERELRFLCRIKLVLEEILEERES